MQAKRQLRAGQALRPADLAKPDLVQRDQAVTLIYEAAGLYLTIRGKAMEAGTEGDVVNVMNLQSKRTVSGVVIGRGQVSVAVPGPRISPVSDAANTDTNTTVIGKTDTAPVSVAANDNASVSRKAE
jgi:flagella basal body P-ring formation protein FlgA